MNASYFLIVSRVHQVQQQMYSAWGLGGAAPPGANAAAAYLRSSLPGAAVPAAVPKKTQKKAPKAWHHVAPGLWEPRGTLALLRFGTVGGYVEMTHGIDCI